MTHRYRIAIGEFAHETNTFCSSPTTTDPFKEYQWFVGDDMVRAHGGNRTYVGGMLAAADERGIAALPTFGATAYPSGTITRAAYDEILATLLAEIERAMPVDAVCLALHGAGVAGVPHAAALLVGGGAVELAVLAAAVPLRREPAPG